MRSKDKTLMAAIEKFVSDYTDSNGISPTMQEVADGVGSSKATVQRYIAQLCDDGILDYSGYRTMTSTKTKAAAIRVPVLGTIACGIPKFAEENIEEYVRLPVALFGKGNFFILRAYGDSMIEAGIDIRHITDGSNVPMYKTNQLCRPAGRLQGELVVSMRPIPADRVADAVTISGRFPAVHGAPVHIGAPELLGIKDIMRPDFGDAVRIEAGEIPVFWACGVTPQAAVMKSGVPFALSHAPGYMFITDIPDNAYHV